MTFEFREETATYDPGLRERWNSGELPRRWRRAYPGVFDDQDLRVALSQPRYHFFEWLGALHYHEKGYSVLVGKYFLQRNERRLKKLLQVLNEGDPSFRSFRTALSALPPDLLIYGKRRRFFFVEVKGPRDRMSDRQRQAFRAIAQRFSTEVRILKFRPAFSVRPS